MKHFWFATVVLTFLSSAALAQDEKDSQKPMAPMSSVGSYLKLNEFNKEAAQFLLYGTLEGVVFQYLVDHQDESFEHALCLPPGMDKEGFYEFFTPYLQGSKMVAPEDPLALHLFMVMKNSERFRCE